METILLDWSILKKAHEFRLHNKSPTEACSCIPLVSFAAQAFKYGATCTYPTDMAAFQLAAAQALVVVQTAAI